MPLYLLPLLAWVMLSCSSSSTDPGPDPGPDPVPGEPVEISWSPLEAENRQVYAPTIQLSGGEGFRELHVERADWDTTLSINGTSVSATLSDFLDFERELLP